jgi:hypothetical protein
MASGGGFYRLSTGVRSICAEAGGKGAEKGSGIRWDELAADGELEWHRYR